MMSKILSLREGILDILVDDDENIDQIEKGLVDLGINIDRQSVKRTLRELVDSLSIKLRYPPNSTMSDFGEADDNTINDFWFKLTPKGKAEWEVVAKAYFNDTVE